MVWLIFTRSSSKYIATQLYLLPSKPPLCHGSSLPLWIIWGWVAPPPLLQRPCPWLWAVGWAETLLLPSSLLPDVFLTTPQHLSGTPHWLKWVRTHEHTHMHTFIYTHAHTYTYQLVFFCNILSLIPLPRSITLHLLFPSPLPHPLPPFFPLFSPFPTSCLQVSEKMQQVLHVKAEDLRMYSMVDENSPVLLEDENKTIEELDLSSVKPGSKEGCAILVESK